MPSTTSSRRSRASSSISNTRQSASLIKVEVSINVYDLLPPGRLSSLLWTVGSGLLHSGVVIHDREYAYGGHNQHAVTGVYWTRPKFEPPGGTWRGTIPQGYAYLQSESDLDMIVKEVSEQFLGTGYNLLTHNCNHVTSALCERLTAKPAPAWLNRAASLGLALPCMVPKEWIAPPDFETAEGELLDEDGDEEDDEEAAMLESDRLRRQRDAQTTRRRAERLDSGEGDEEDEGEGGSIAGGKRLTGYVGTPPARLVSITDTSGKRLPVAERAPLPKRMSREI